MGLDIDAVHRQVDSVKFDPNLTLCTVPLPASDIASLRNFYSQDQRSTKVNVWAPKIMQPYLLLALPVEPSRSFQPPTNKFQNKNVTFFSFVSNRFRISRQHWKLRTLPELQKRCLLFLLRRQRHLQSIK